MDVKKGDVVEVLSNRVGQPNQRGTVRRVIDREPVRMEVAWEDGHTSEFVPAAGNTRVVEHHG